MSNILYHPKAVRQPTMPLTFQSTKAFQSGKHAPQNVFCDLNRRDSFKAKLFFFPCSESRTARGLFPEITRCHPQHLRKVSRQALRRQRRMPPSHTMTSSRHECHSLPSGRTKREFHPPLASSSEDIAAAPAQQTPRCCVHLHKKQKSYVSYNPQPTDLPARSRRRACPGAWECKKR